MIAYGHYILDGTLPVPCDDFYTWAQWFETHNRHVAFTEIAPELEVSTVFLGIDHRFGDGPPLLFETMVFRHGRGEEQARYSTWHEAEQGHEAMCAQVRAALSSQ